MSPLMKSISNCRWIVDRRKNFNPMPAGLPCVSRGFSQITFADAQAIAASVRQMSGSSADQIYSLCRNQVMKLAPDLLYLQ